MEGEGEVEEEEGGESRGGGVQRWTLMEREWEEREWKAEGG